MFNYLKIVSMIISFVFLGEFFLKINENYNLLTLKRRLKIDSNKDFYQNYKLNKNKIDSLNNNQNLNTFRIMILGDSRLLGFGLEKKYRFKNKLKNYLINDTNCEIFDYSGLSFNIFNNYVTFNKYFESIKPDIVILGWNYDDLLGNPSDNYSNYLKKNHSIFESIYKPTTIENEKNLISKIKFYYDTSPFLAFFKATIIHYTHKFGFSIPFGEYNRIINHLYYNNNKDWESAKKMISNIVKSINKTNSKLIILKIPDFDILERKHFNNIDLILKKDFESYKEIIYIDSKNYFLNDYQKTLSISKYDGHPNAFTIDKISKNISNIINKIHNE